MYLTNTLNIVKVPARGTRWKRWHLLLSLSDGCVPINMSVTGEASHGEQHRPHGWSRTGGARLHCCPRHCPHFAHGLPGLALPHQAACLQAPALPLAPSQARRSDPVPWRWGARGERRPCCVRGPATPGEHLVGPDTAQQGTLSLCKFGYKPEKTLITLKWELPRLIWEQRWLIALQLSFLLCGTGHSSGSLCVSLVGADSAAVGTHVAAEQRPCITPAKAQTGLHHLISSREQRKPSRSIEAAPNW